MKRGIVASALLAVLAACDFPTSSGEWERPYRCGFSGIPHTADAPNRLPSEFGPIMADLNAGGFRHLWDRDVSWFQTYRGGDYADSASWDFSAFMEVVADAGESYIVPTLFQNNPTQAEERLGEGFGTNLYTPDGEVLDVCNAKIKAKVEGYIRNAVLVAPMLKHWMVAAEVPQYVDLDPWKYAALLDVCRDVLQSLGSEYKVVLAPPAGTTKEVFYNHLEFYEEVFRQPGGCSFDIAAFHFYDAWTELEPAIAAWKACLRNAGLSDRPMWMTETGASYIPSSTPPHTVNDSEAEQACQVVRMFTMAFGEGVETCNWHTFQSVSESPGAAWSGQGVLKSNGKKVLSYWTYQLFAGTLGTFDRCVAVSKGEGNAWVYRYEVDGRKFWVAWTDVSSGTTFDLRSETIASLVTSTSFLSDDAGRFSTSRSDPRSLSLSQTPILVTGYALPLPSTFSWSDVGAIVK